MSRTSRAGKQSQIVYFYGLAVIVLILDQMTKHAILLFLREGESVPILENVFHLTLVYNTGVAFGFFSNHINLLLILISLSIVFLFFFSFSLAGADPWNRFCFACILGGALGNWVDRIRYHAVIDFLDFRVWPVFNLADSAITTGVALYLFLLMRKPPECKSTTDSI